MDATTMPSTSSLVHKLTQEYPQFTFVPDSEFHWSPQKKSIFYAQDSAALLLHELAHALLGHTSYARDVVLIEMERDAWAYARTTLAPQYNLKITDDEIDSSLDTYRDWLHARSICPECKATGVQIQTDEYKCLACYTHWHVNEARTCALRRYKVTHI